MENRNRPELMSPAGHWPQMRAAIEAGADAVYFGLKHFTARAKVGFTSAELPEAVALLHERGVRAFVTFNTLIFDHELRQATEALESIANSGADAVIVQDIAAAKLAKAIAPELAIHGSTQMSVTSAEGVELAAGFGCSRVVLARELSLKDISGIREQTDVELEVFVHGALCVSYSGQCFSSEAWGGRSANRGQCAQACRLPYELVVDGRHRDLGAARYLLSPGDLFAIEQVPELVRIGVSCLKIEGRYKDADYVALTTAAYRKAIDAAVAGTEFRLEQGELEDLEQVYSRGLGPWFMSGVDHQKVVVGRAPRHRGVLVGKVERVIGQRTIRVAAIRSVFRGDGLVLDAADRRSPGEQEQGGFVFDVVEGIGGQVDVSFGDGVVDTADISPGDLVWRTLDPTLSRRLKRLTEANDPVRTLPVTAKVTAVPGHPLRIELRCHRFATLDGGELSTEVRDDEVVQKAGKRATDELRIREQMERMGGSPFRLATLECELADDAFVPVSKLNHLRRQAVGQLRDLLREVDQTVDRSAADQLLSPLKAKSPVLVGETKEPCPGSRNPAMRPQIHLLVRNSEQLPGAIQSGPDSITLDYLELYGLRNSVEKVRESGIEVRVASPRVLKPNEQRVVEFLLSLDCQILVRSGGLLQELSRRLKNGEVNCEIHGDFSLNMANAVSVRELVGLGLGRWTPTHDLNGDQIMELAGIEAGPQMEVVAFHHLPIFHTEHCVFCRFMSQGTDHTNCGHPCEKHQIALRDAQGRQHPVLADVGCRNTVFNASIQSAAKYLDRWIARGIRHVRLEFVHQNAERVNLVAEAMKSFVEKAIDYRELERIFASSAPDGAVEGSLYVPSDYRQLVQLS